jgi:hypothetical protein
MLCVIIQIVKDSTQVEEVEGFRYLGSVISSDETREKYIITRIGIAKTAFIRNGTLQTNKISLGFNASLTR